MTNLMRKMAYYSSPDAVFTCIICSATDLSHILRCKSRIKQHSKHLALTRISQSM